MATIVPPPVLDTSLQQALMGFAQPFAQGLATRGQRRLTQQDIQSIQNWMAQQQTRQETPWLGGGVSDLPAHLGGVMAPLNQFPQMQSQMGQQMAMQGQMGNIFGDPFGVQRTKAQLQTAQVQATQQILPKEKLTRATTLRKEFQAHPVYKSFQTIERSEKSMKVAYEKSVADKTTKSRIASDQALGVLFQKLLDPTSVVRESEYARTPEGAGIMSRIKSVLPRLARGGLGISNEDRKELYEMAEALLVVAKEQMNKHIANYTGFAQSYDVDPKLVLGNLQRFDIDSKTPSVLNATNSTTGKKIISYDGGQTWRPAQ